MPTEIPALTDFLLARIAEDEATVADWPDEGPWGVAPNGEMWCAPTGAIIYAPRRRVLAECEAKRRIVADADAGLPRGHSLDVTIGSRLHGESTLRVLATIYADHPDYQKEWAA